MLPPVRFGKAYAEVDQAALDDFRDRPKKYIKYKTQFNTLTRLVADSRDTLERMSDKTRITCCGLVLMKRDDWGHEHSVRMAPAVEVVTQDLDRQKAVEQTLKKRRTESLSHFWKRVLKLADTMDRTLAGDARPVISDKAGTYTIKE